MTITSSILSSVDDGRAVNDTWRAPVLIHLGHDAANEVRVRSPPVCIRAALSIYALTSEKGAGEFIVVYTELLFSDRGISV